MMLAGTGRPTPWRFSPCSGLAKKGLLTSWLCILVAGAALCCLSRLHVSDICQGGHPLPETDFKVWDDTARFCRGYVRSARQTSNDFNYTTHQSGDREGWDLGPLWLMEARAEIGVFVTGAAGLGLVFWFPVFLVHLTWRRMKTSKRVKQQGGAAKQPLAPGFPRRHSPASKDPAKEPLPTNGGSEGVKGQMGFNIVADSRDELQTGGAQGNIHPPPSSAPSPAPSPTPSSTPSPTPPSPAKSSDPSPPQGTDLALGVAEGPTPASTLTPDAAEEAPPSPAATAAESAGPSPSGSPVAPTSTSAAASLPVADDSDAVKDAAGQAPTPPVGTAPEQQTAAPASAAGGFSFGASSSGATGSGSTGAGAFSFGATTSGTSGNSAFRFGTSQSGAETTGAGGSSQPAGGARSKGRTHRGRAAAPALSVANVNPSLFVQEAAPFPTQATQGPDQLDLAWLHTLAGQVASPAFIPPPCEFEVLEGAHTQAVISFATKQCHALEQTSSCLTASGLHTFALDLATQALEMRYGWSLGAVELCQSHCLRGRIFSSMGMPTSAFVEYIRASQADVEGLGCVEVAAQLAEWGLTTHMHNFGEQCQAAFGAQHAGWRHMAHADCLSSWNTAAVAIQNVLSVDMEVCTAGSELGERILQQLKALTDNWPCHQPLACRKALLELRLHKFGDALATAQQFVRPKVGQECAPAQWAVHLSAHAYWLQGQLPMACAFLEQAACMQPSCLEQESGVAYTLPSLADMHSAHAQLGQLTQSWTDIVRALGSGDVHSASAIMEQLRQAQRAAACAGMSPGCCAQQLIHEASIRCAWANLADPLNIGRQCIKGLTACELAVAMEPSMWWQAVQLQSWLLDRLLASAAKLTLLQGLQADKGGQFTLEQAGYFSNAIPAAMSQARSQLEVGAGTMDYSMLFGIHSSNITEVEVKRASKALLMVCHSDTASRSYFTKHSQSVPGLGSIYSSGQEADERRGMIRDTLLLVQSAVTDLYPESGVRSTGFEAGPHPDPTPGPAVPAPTPSDDESMENSDDLPEYESD